jgi:hypothetical protein
MLDGEAALVTVVQDEGRAVHAVGDAKRLRDAFHQLRLSRAELTFERDDVSRLNDLTQATPQLAGLLN